GPKPGLAHARQGPARGKSDHGSDARWRGRPPHEGNPALRAFGDWSAYRLAISDRGPHALFRCRGIPWAHRGPSGRPLGKLADDGSVGLHGINATRLSSGAERLVPGRPNAAQE